MTSKLALRLEDRNLSTILKLAEVKLFRASASTYSYNHPSHVYLELTPRCNLRCGWCVQRHEQFRRDHSWDMPFSTFLNIVAKLNGTNVLYLCMNGEPLLYERIHDAVREARGHVPSVRFVTNGTLLSRDISVGLKAAGLSQLGISIDSTDPEFMHRIRGVSLSAIESNVRMFCESTGIPVEIRTTICEENVDTLEALPAYAMRFTTCRLLYFTLAEGIAEVGSSPMSMVRSRERFMRLKRAVVKSCGKLGLRTNLEYMGFYPQGFFERQREGRCDVLFGRHLAINHKGCVMPCCRYWNVDLDNLSELSFEDAWNGRLTRAWRSKMLARRYTEECSNWCGYPAGD